MRKKPNLQTLLQERKLVELLTVEFCSNGILPQSRNNETTLSSKFQLRIFVWIRYWFYIITQCFLKSHDFDQFCIFSIIFPDYSGLNSDRSPLPSFVHVPFKNFRCRYPVTSDGISTGKGLPLFFSYSGITAHLCVRYTQNFRTLN